MRHALSALTLASLLAVPALLAPAHAKLPAASDEAKAKAAAAAAKTAWSDKVAAYQLCGAMNRAADHYRKAAKAAGKDAPAATETPACADPGPFVAPVPVAAASGAAAAPVVAAAPPAAAPKK
jgi:hypothetical protein